MGRNLLLFIFLMISFSAVAQRTIKGIVIDINSSQPLAGSSVFISNTSRGTVSDKQGNFELADIPTGKYDLVVSSVGYETNVYSFSTDQLPLNLRIEMRVKVRELENVTVEPSVIEGWDKWGQTFTDYFLGRTPNTARCKIKNTKAIKFRYYRKSNRVIAYADEPIIVENKALGYRVSYQLEDFEVKFSERISLFAGYPLFEDMEKRLRPRTEKNRNEAFYGSMMQFMRSFYNNTLQEDGFEVRRMFREPNLEKQRVRQVYKTYKGSIVSDGKMKITVGGNAPPIVTAGDSSDYYQRILRQDDWIDTYGRILLNADSLMAGKEGEFKFLYFDDYLYITYKKEIEDKMYLQVMHESRPPAFQQSHIWLTQKQAIAVDPNGSYYPPQNIFTMSYWGWSEKISNMLPLDYRPGK